MTAREWLDAVEAEDGMTNVEKKVVIAALRAVLDLCDDLAASDAAYVLPRFRAAIDTHLGGAS